MNICVYAGSKEGSDPEFTKAAYELGEYIGKNNYHLIYGAGNIGLMGVLADSVLKHQGRVTGIIPEKLVNLEVAHTSLTELIVTKNMHERKAKMAEMADIFVALPGSVGTFDELFEILCWNQLKIIQKSLYILNIKSYYNPLIELINNSRNYGFLDKLKNINHHICNSLTELSEKLQETE